MKRLLLVLVLALGSFSLVYGQTGAFQEAVSNHYRVFSEISLTHAQETADMLDACMTFYNGYLHFDLSKLPTKLRVRIFSNKANFDSYLASIPGLKGQKINSFVYLQYNDLAKSELVGYYMDDSSFQKSIIHHGFIQFLKAFVPNPPLWLQNGFAVYLEQSVYDKAKKTVTFKDNLTWVNTLKKIAANPSGSDVIQLPALLSINVDNANKQIDSFYAESWGLVSFLLNSPLKQYNRIMWDSLSKLNTTATMAGNDKILASEVFSWVGTDKFYADFATYLDTVKTFPELVKEGMSDYSSNQLAKAEKVFLQAVDRNGKNPIPYYYLGLIHYTRKDYSLAEYYYQTAQQMGADPGLTNYALGVNAFADNRLDAAKSYLQKADSADHFTYGDKVAALLKRIAGE